MLMKHVGLISQRNVVLGTAEAENYTKPLLIRLHLVEGIDPHHTASQIMFMICLSSVACM